MRADLLELVCKDLDNDPPFNFEQWVSDRWRGKPDLSCGAPACALGRATTIPELQKLGLVLRRSKPSRFGYGALGVGYVDLFENEVADYLAASDCSVAAAMRVFELTSDEAYYLFVPSDACSEALFGADSVPSDDASPREVAAHIRDFIARGGLPKRAEER